MLISLSSLDFAKLLKRFRKIREYKQKDLAVKSGISSVLISHFESGKRKPTRNNVLRLVAGLELSSRKAKDLFLMAAGHAPTEETISKIISNDTRTPEEEAEFQEYYRLGKSYTLIIGEDILYLW